MLYSTFIQPFYSLVPFISIADLVQRFNESTQLALPGLTCSPEHTRSAGGSRRQSPRQYPSHDISDSDHSSRNRPRLRRGKTEQPSHRQRDASRPGLMSDGDRSYATNASRISSSSHLHRSVGESKNNDYPTVRPSMGSRAPSYTSNIPPRSGRASPKLRYPVVTHVQSLFDLEEGKPRVAGKGKSPRRPESTTPIVGKNVGRRSQSGTSRVNSIARHFDRLSREAEKERQKRISVVRGKRARPVSVTKAKVQVFDNLRDAFKDEFDTDSSEADNEEDELGSDDSLGSADEPISRTKAESFSNNSSPTRPIGSSVPMATSPSLLPEASLSKDDLVTMSPPIASETTTSILSDSKSEKSFTDRLKIELPSFETSAPLPSHPATPQVHTDTTTADEALGAVSASQTSDVETSTANEKSSLLKSLSGLWAFRAADFAPLEYPL